MHGKYKTENEHDKSEPWNVASKGTALDTEINGVMN